MLLCAVGEHSQLDPAPHAELGEDPAEVDTDTVDARVARNNADGVITLAGTHKVGFNSKTDLVLHRRKSLPAHPNGMTFEAYDAGGFIVAERSYYSVGGGFAQCASAAIARIRGDFFPFEREQLLQPVEQRWRQRTIVMLDLAEIRGRDA